MDCIKVNVERVVFYNDDNGFIIIKSKHPETKEPITIKGNFINIDDNTPIICNGSFFNDKKYGLQFVAESIKIDQLDDKNKILTYLSSGTISGIGPKTAEKIVEKFQENTLKILDEDISKLNLISGIGSSKIKIIQKSWIEKRESQNIISELLNYGFSYKNSIKIYKDFGNSSLSLIKKNPYILLDKLNKIGFDVIDKIALKMGINDNNELRIIYAIKYIISKNENNYGDTCVEKNILIQQLENLLKIKYNFDEIINLLSSKEYSVLYQTEINGDYYIQSEKTYKYENYIATKLKEIKEHSNKFEIEKKIISKYFENQKFPYTEEQIKSVNNTLNNKVSIITGGPGVGKTTILKAIIDIISIKYKDKTIIKLASPTGKAAQKMSDKTGFEAKTIHRLLEYNVESNSFNRNNLNKLDDSFIIIDEFSMVDVFILFSLLNATSNNSNIIFIGDVDQLESVGYGANLRDIIESNLFSCSRLTINNRQENEFSDIIINAHLINNEKIFNKNKENSDFYYINTKNEQDTLDKLIQMINNNIPKKFGYKNQNDIQILTPMHNGLLGTINLNKIFQKVFNKNAINGYKKIEFGENVYYEGDKVIQTKNNYDKLIFNGDTGEIKEINGDYLIVNFNGSDVELKKSELTDISLFYAGTIHKSQGSEYPVTILVYPNICSPVMNKESLYTGITRGQNLVIVLASINIINWMIKNKDKRKRLTLLKTKLLN